MPDPQAGILGVLDPNLFASNPPSLLKAAGPYPWYDVTNSAYAGGAKGDGVTDDTAAIQAAITAAAAQAGNTGPLTVAAGGTVYFPAGTYKVSATLQCSLMWNVSLRGAGKRATAIKPTTALAGLPVIRWTDCRDMVAESMHIFGTSSGAPAECAIQSFRSGQSGTILGLDGHGHKVFNCMLGDDGGFAGMVYGIEYLAANNTATVETNNDEGVFDNVEIINFTGAAFHFGHMNSVLHSIIACNIFGGPTAVLCHGGSFNMVGGAIGDPMSGYLFDFQAVNGFTTNYTHQSVITTEIECAGAGVGVIRSNVGATNLDVALMGVNWYTAPVAATSMFQWDAPAGHLTVMGSHFNFGQANKTATFSDAASVVKFIGNTGLGCDLMTYSGILQLVCNRHIPGTVTLTNAGGGVLTQIADTGGGFDQRVWQGTLWANQLNAGITGGPKTTIFSNGFIQSSATISLGQSATAVAITNGATIAVGTIGVSRVNPAGNVTGIILATAGLTVGQLVTVVNESAFTVTFAAAGTSSVADGVADVIPALTARTFVWDSGTSLWYRAA